LNKLMHAALEAHPPAEHQGKQPKIYFAAQVACQPPTIVLFCNDPRAVSPQYQRYLLGVFRGKTPFREVPVKFYLRRRQRGEAYDQIDGKLSRE
jgi:GTP-binding protein